MRSLLLILALTLAASAAPAQRLWWSMNHSTTTVSGQTGAAIANLDAYCAESYAGPTYVLSRETQTGATVVLQVTGAGVNFTASSATLADDKGDTGTLVTSGTNSALFTILHVSAGASQYTVSGLSAAGSYSICLSAYSGVVSIGNSAAGTFSGTPTSTYGATITTQDSGNWIVGGVGAPSSFTPLTPAAGQVIRASALSTYHSAFIQDAEFNTPGTVSISGTDGMTGYSYPFLAVELRTQ
jgi:hypothetical protein